MTKTSTLHLRMGCGEALRGVLMRSTNQRIGVSLGAPEKPVESGSRVRQPKKQGDGS